MHYAWRSHCCSLWTVSAGTLILFVPGVVNESTTYEECWQRSIESIRRTLPLATDQGATISIGNVWINFITTSDEALRYLDEIDSPRVGGHLPLKPWRLLHGLREAQGVRGTDLWSVD